MSQNLAPPSIEGTWQMVKAELAGEAAPELVVQKTEIEFRAGTYVVRFAGEETDRGSYEHGGTAESRTIILRGTFGTNAGRIIPSIYQLVGDRLRICYGFDNVMPTVFAGDRSGYLAIYRRTKPLDETALISRGL